MEERREMGGREREGYWRRVAREEEREDERERKRKRREEIRGKS